MTCARSPRSSWPRSLQTGTRLLSHIKATFLHPLLSSRKPSGRYVAVEALLDAGADPNFCTIVFTPFMHAASKGHTKIMQLLRERGAGLPPFMLALLPFMLAAPSFSGAMLPFMPAISRFSGPMLTCMGPGADISYQVPRLDMTLNGDFVFPLSHVSFASMGEEMRSMKQSRLTLVPATTLAG
eukprot:1406525-Rhodomonas_salina.2